MICGVSSRRTFETLRREGIRVRGPRLALTYTPLDAGVQVAFAIPKRVGGAVTRNRTRRRVRALLDERARRGDLRPGAYLVQVAAPIDSLDSTSLQADVARLLGALDARMTGQ